MADIDVPRTYRRKLRSLIHISQRFGPAALREFGISNKAPRDYLRGKVAFAVFVNPRNKVFAESLKRIAF